MKIKAVFFLALLVFLGLAVAKAQFAYAGTASQDASDVYQNTQAFDGGPGSTINTSPAAADQANSQSE